MSAPNSLRPAGLQPEVEAVDVIRPAADAFAGPQSAGFTAALTAPATGIFRGRSAVINLAGATAQDMIVKAPVALHIGFQPLASVYPNSLLGVFSALRQSFLDAQRYAAMESAYAKNPRGMRRPENDPSLAALVPALTRQVPVVMAASEQREIERALNLAKEFNLRPIIAGGEEADKVAARLKAENVPVLLSLNFPRAAGPASPEADPEPLRVLRQRVEAPKTAAKLAQAGVRFAFESGAVSNWLELAQDLSRAVDNGLTVDQAVRALTLSPAEILGVNDRLGSIETGKIANLTITRGDLPAGRVTQVFIDGRPIDIRAGANAGAGMASGTWTVTVTTSEGDKPITLQLMQQGDALRGTLQGSLGTAQIQNGSITIVGQAPSPFVGTRPEAGTGGRRGRPPHTTTQGMGRER